MCWRTSSSKWRLAMRIGWSSLLAVGVVFLGCGGPKRVQVSPIRLPAKMPEETLKSTNDRDVKKLLEAVTSAHHRRDLPAAIAAAESARRLQPNHRKVLLVLSSLLLSRGRQMVLLGERAEATPYFYRAAQAMRDLHANFPDLDEVERRMLNEAVYFEAASLAVDDDRDRAIVALHEALAAGFSDWDQLDDDADFDTLRKDDAFQAVVAPYRKSPTSK